MWSLLYVDWHAELPPGTNKFCLASCDQKVEQIAGMLAAALRHATLQESVVDLMWLAENVKLPQ